MKASVNSKYLRYIVNRTNEDLPAEVREQVLDLIVTDDAQLPKAQHRYACTFDLDGQRAIYLNEGGISSLKTSLHGQAVLAHEVAHIVLRHENGDDVFDEDEADQLTRKWGFLFLPVRYGKY